MLNWLTACPVQQCAGAAGRRAPTVARQLCCAPSARSFRASCLLLSLRPPPAQSRPRPSPLIANHGPAPLQEFASDRVIVSFKPDVVRAMAAEEEGLKFQKPAGLQVGAGGGMRVRQAALRGSRQPQRGRSGMLRTSRFHPARRQCKLGTHCARQWAGHLQAAQQASNDLRRLTVCCCPGPVYLHCLF